MGFQSGELAFIYDASEFRIGQIRLENGLERVQSFGGLGRGLLDGEEFLPLGFDPLFAGREPIDESEGLCDEFFEGYVPAGPVYRFVRFPE